MKAFLVFFSFFYCALLPVRASEDKTVPSYGRMPAVTAHITALSKAHDLDEPYLQALMMKIHRNDGVLEKISRPAEKTLPWYAYRKIFLDQARIRNGAAFYRRKRDWLDQAYRRYGVDPFIITAIIGAETRYGKITGNIPVLAALATLCFDYPPRAKFFCAQFDDFLILAQHEHWNPLEITGSYAGALGMGQFMPESYRNDALDFDDDGSIDLWHSPADAIGSIANYLNQRGWRKDGGLVYPLVRKPANPGATGTYGPSVPRARVMRELNLLNDETFIEWSGDNPPDFLASLSLQGEDRELYWLIDNNFFVITRYNNSPMYAMAVIDLATQIEAYVNRESGND